MTIFVVARSQLIAQGIAAMITQAGLSVSPLAPHRADEALKSASLIVLHLETRSDIELAGKFYARGIPVLAVSSNLEGPDRTNALKTGCLDLIPADNTDELLVKVKTISRIWPREDVRIPLRDDRYIDVLWRRVVRSGTSRDISETEMRLFLMLYEEYRLKPRQPVRPDILARRMWGSARTRSTSTLRSHINNLREKIEDTPESPAIILSARNKGYWLSLCDASTRTVIISSQP